MTDIPARTEARPASPFVPGVRPPMPKSPRKIHDTIPL